MTIFLATKLTAGESKAITYLTFLALAATLMGGVTGWSYGCESTSIRIVSTVDGASIVSPGLGGLSSDRRGSAFRRNRPISYRTCVSAVAADLVAAEARGCIISPM